MSEPTPVTPDPKDDSGARAVGEAAEQRQLDLNPAETLLPLFSLRRRITVSVLVLTVLVLGVVAALTTTIELIPSGFSSPFLRVGAPWQDAPPQEVLDKVVLPLEEELSTVSGLEHVNSYARTGYGQVFLSFKQRTDMDVAYREVRDRIERARAHLPEDLEQVFVFKDDDSSIPVAMVGITIDEALLDPYELIEREIVLPLERVDGVAAVDRNGLVEKEILIELDRQRVEAAGLNIYQVAQDLARDNFALASGSVLVGGKKLLLRSVARYATPSSVRDVMVAPSVRLSDVAAVRYDVPDAEFRVRVNSQPALALMLRKEAEANTLEVSRAVADLVASFADNPRLAGVQAAMIMDQGVIIMDSLSVLLDSGRMGAFFAMVVLFFFLRRLRMSLIIALSIPLSIVVALVVMFFAGESLNILSLLGLMISVGLLVDNSVVVAENIHRLHRQGLTRMQACLQGTGEISLAIVTATLTTVVVFLPVALVEGQGQFFMMRMAIPITVSLLASLIVALTVVPLAMYLTLPSRSALASATGRWRRAHERLNGVLRRAYEATFGRLGRGYQAALGYFLQRRLDLVLLLVVAFVATGFLVKGRLEVVPMSQDDQSGFQVGVRMPSNTTFEETEAWFRSAEVRIAALQEDLGLEFYVLFHQRNFGQIQGSLRSDRDQELKPRVVVERLLEALPELPGLELDTGQASEGGDEQAVATETVTIFGDDPEALDEIGVLLEERLATLPGVLGLLSTRDRQPNELALVPDRELTQRLGVEPRTLAGVVGYALRGQALPRIYFGGRDIPVRVRFEESDRSSLAELRSFAVPTPEGSAALSSLVSVEQLPAATAISRRDKRTARRVVLELEEGQEKEGRAAIRQALTAIDLPEGMSFAPPAASDANAREIRNLQFAALLSILFVYLLMGFLFESFVLPISILVTIPLASLGVLWSHLLARRDLDFLGMVAVIVLIGVVVNNGIVLVDYVHRLREAGMPRFESLLAASERRFRPIMMTALTTICGMVPLVLATPTQMGISYKSFGLALIGGMVTSTLLTLLVVPVFYTFLEDGREACGRALRQAIAGGRRRGSALDQPTRVIDGEADFGELAASRVE